MSLKLGDTEIAGLGGGSVKDIDNVTITKNATDKIQTVATVNQNTVTGATNPVYNWVGTLEEYNTQNIETLHPDWVCYITDDVSGGDSVYTKEQVNSLLALKVSTGHEVIAFQAPTAQNNYTWYRKYADGWVEQGGLATIPSRTGQGGSSMTVTFPIPMADYNYTGQISYQAGGAGFAQSEITMSAKQTTSVHLDFWTDLPETTASFLVGWEIKGMAA